MNTKFPEPDLYNVRSVKLAESTRVRLYLPGLGTGVGSEWDEEEAKPGAGLSKQTSDTARKNRKKLARIQALTSTQSQLVDGLDLAVAPVVLADEEVALIEEIELRCEQEAAAAAVAAAAASAAAASAAVSSGPASLGDDRTFSNSNATTSKGAAGAAGSHGSSKLNSTGRGTPPTPGTGARSQKSSSTSDSHRGALSTAPEETGTFARARSVSEHHRAPIWTRSIPAASTQMREKMTPPPPKVFKAVQAKTLCLGIDVSPNGMPPAELVSADGYWPAWVRNNNGTHSNPRSQHDLLQRVESFKRGAAERFWRNAHNSGSSSPNRSSPASRLQQRLYQRLDPAGMGMGLSPTSDSDATYGAVQAHTAPPRVHSSHASDAYDLGTSVAHREFSSPQRVPSGRSGMPSSGMPLSPSSLSPVTQGHSMLYSMGRMAQHGASYVPTNMRTPPLR